MLIINNFDNLIFPLGGLCFMQNYLILTDQQKNIWNTEMFFPNSSVNHIGGYINIEQKIDSEILEKTANLYVQHTDSIRSHFIQGDNGPLQYISDYKHFSVDVVSISDQKNLTLYATGYLIHLLVLLIPIYLNFKFINFLMEEAV